MGQLDNLDCGYCRAPIAEHRDVTMLQICLHRLTAMMNSSDDEGPTGCADDGDELGRALRKVTPERLDAILAEELPNRTSQAKPCICGHVKSAHMMWTKKRNGAPCYACNCADYAERDAIRRLTTTQQQEGE
jgi:hypothetical protein